MRYTFLKSSNCHFTLYDSLDESIEAGLRHKVACNENSPISRSEFLGREFDSFDQIAQAARSEWADGLEVLGRMTNDLGDAMLAPPKNTRRRQCFSDDCGDEVDLDRLQRGQPYWRTTMREHRVSQRTITIVTDLTTSAYVEHNDVLWRGAAAIILTKMLEAAGYRVELWVADNSKDTYRDGKNRCSATCLKQTSDPLDISTLVNAVSGWFYRSIVFATHWECGEPVSCLGLPVPLKPMLPQITSDSTALVCEKMWSFKESVTWIREQLKQFE